MEQSSGSPCINMLVKMFPPGLKYVRFYSESSVKVRTEHFTSGSAQNIMTAVSIFWAEYLFNFKVKL